MITFADGNPAIKLAGSRLVQQCQSIELFTKCIVIDDFILELLSDGETKLTRFIKENERGHGFWAWKSFVIASALDGKFGKFDGVFYTDAGTEILNNGITRMKFRRLMKKTHKLGVVTFLTNGIEEKFTKKSVLSLLIDVKQRETYQREATTIFVSSLNSAGPAIIREWDRLAKGDNFSQLSDFLSKDESPLFIDHRHDQSLLSIVLKNANVKSSQINCPTYHNGRITTFQRLLFNSWPIWQIRNRSGTSVLSRWQGSNVLAFLFLPCFCLRKYLLAASRILTKLKFWLTKRLRTRS